MNMATKKKSAVEEWGDRLRAREAKKSREEKKQMQEAVRVLKIWAELGRRFERSLRTSTRKVARRQRRVGGR
jgi:hypothetical protein